LARRRLARARRVHRFDAGEYKEILMDRPWLSHYPKGVPHDIDMSQYGSLVELIDDAFTRHASRDAYYSMGKTLRYAEVDALSKAFAGWLQSRGMAPGARVALMMPNILQYPVCIAAVLRAGYVVVNANPMYTARELQHQLHDSGAEAIVVLENFATTVAQVISRTAIKHVVVASMGDLLGALKGTVVNFMVRRVKKMVPAYDLPNATSFRSALAAGRRAGFKPVKVGLEDVAFLQYTGGTTGVAKGATLLHRNLLANVLQSQAWLQPGLDRKGAALPDQIVIAAALPLYHVFALTVCCLLGLRSGALLLLIPNPRDMGDMIKILAKFQDKIVILPAVNTLFNALLRNAEFAKLKFPALRISMGGGMAVQKAVAQKWLALTGCPICEGYGLSETSPSAISNPTDTDEYSGTIGMPLPSTEVLLLDDDGKTVPQGEPGEISIRGPQLMAGYWNMPGETEHAINADGYFKSGDIGVMDERGYIRIVDRKKDMILVSGFNVYPNEVEDVVMEHPGVREAAAVGIPDESCGESVKLFIVREDPALTEKDVLHFCRDRLTGYKRPRHVEFRDELPKTNVGKILRRALRDEHTKQVSA
jgi:long-chain acyl-CoA synthetase